MIISSLNQKETTLWTFHKIKSFYKFLKLSVDNQNITWYDSHILKQRSTVTKRHETLSHIIGTNRFQKIEIA